MEKGGCGFIHERWVVERLMLWCGEMERMERRLAPERRMMGNHCCVWWAIPVSNEPPDFVKSSSVQGIPPEKA